MSKVINSVLVAVALLSSGFTIEARACTTEKVKAVEAAAKLAEQRFNAGEITRAELNSAIKEQAHERICYNDVNNIEQCAVAASRYGDARKLAEERFKAGEVTRFEVDEARMLENEALQYCY